MMIGDQLRALHEQQELSQGDIEKRTGLLRCYVSRVENGHTIQSIETLEKWARALNVSFSMRARIHRLRSRTKLRNLDSGAPKTKTHAI
jgi:transcriptional regulator with XRE-family HTH domain